MGFRRYLVLCCGRLDVVNVLPQIRAGKLRGLGVTSAAASPQAPEIPPISSVIPGFEVMIWIGYVAPAGMPRETLAKLNEHMVRALRSPEVSSLWKTEVPPLRQARLSNSPRPCKVIWNDGATL